MAGSPPRGFCVNGWLPAEGSDQRLRQWEAVDSGEIAIVGLGPGPLCLLTVEARTELEKANKVFFRMRGHPVYRWLAERGTQLIDFSPLYAVGDWEESKRYQFMADAVLKEARLKGAAVYALPGNPHVFERTSVLIRRSAASTGLRVRVLPGLSFLDLLYIELQLDPGLGLQIYNSWQLNSSGKADFSPRVGLVVGQVDPGTGSVRGQYSLSWVRDQLLLRYPPDHLVWLVWVEARPDYRTYSLSSPLCELTERSPGRGEFATLYVPELPG